MKRAPTSRGEFHMIPLKIVNFNQMKTKTKKISGFLFAAILLFTACDKEDDGTPSQMDEKNIVEIAQEAGSFSILIEAAQKASLADFLSTESGITVFAPTDDAFAALLSDLNLSSLDDIDATTLAAILTYHVVGGVAYSGDLSTGYYSTLASYSDNNLSMFINLEEGVKINKDVSMTTADVEASNGVIHVVDKVILPPSVVSIAIANENFSTLVAAVTKAGLVDALEGDGPFTVFAPTNDAFDALFSELGVSGVEDLTAEQLTPILTYHVVLGNVLSGALTAGPVETLNTSSITVGLSGGVKIDNSSVIAADIQGANGVVHVIDKVLLP
jgi:transforming growth factor-beta-induced protein